MADPTITVELPEAVTKALADIERLSAELAKLSKPDPDADPSKLTVGLESAQKEYARIETDLAKAREELTKAIEARTTELKEARAQVEKMTRQRRRESFIKRCEPLASLPGTQADDFAETLDLIEAGLRQIVPDRAEKLFAKFYERLTSWNVVIEKNNLLFKEIGRVGGEMAYLSGVEAQVEALAREKMAADPKLSKPQAIDKVLRERPELYRKSVAQSEGGQ